MRVLGAVIAIGLFLPSPATAQVASVQQSAAAERDRLEAQRLKDKQQGQFRMRRAPVTATQRVLRRPWAIKKPTLRVRPAYQPAGRGRRGQVPGALPRGRVRPPDRLGRVQPTNVREIRTGSANLLIRFTPPPRRR